jgi:hypothetical protein
VLRGAAVGLAATLLGVGGHWLAGGGPPTWPATASAAVLLGTAGIALSRVRWTLPRLLTLLLLSQLGLHLFFGWTQAAPAAPGHASAHTADASATLVPTNPEMLVAHVAAAVATALLLRRGEVWLGGVLDALALRAVRLLDAVVVVPAARPRPVPVRVPDEPRRQAPADAWWERGPPR